MNSIAESETDSAVGFAIENKSHFVCVVVESVGSAVVFVGNGQINRYIVDEWNWLNWGIWLNTVTYYNFRRNESQELQFNYDPVALVPKWELSFLNLVSRLKWRSRSIVKTVGLIKPHNGPEFILVIFLVLLLLKCICRWAPCSAIIAQLHRPDNPIAFCLVRRFVLQHSQRRRVTPMTIPSRNTLTGALMVSDDRVIGQNLTD